MHSAQHQLQTAAQNLRQELWITVSMLDGAEVLSRADKQILEWARKALAVMSA